MRKSHLDSRPRVPARGRASERVPPPPRKGFGTVVDRACSTAPTVAATSADRAAAARRRYRATSIRSPASD